MNDCCAPNPANAARVSISGVASAERAAMPQRQESAEKAELLVTGSLITLDDSQPRAEAMAVSKGRILAVGSRADVEGFVGPGTKTLAHTGGVIMPGFVEPHVHLVSSALVFDGVDCSPYTNKTLDAVLVALKAAVATAPAGQAVVGQLFDPSLLPNQATLTLDLLDQISATVPIVVMNASQHFFYVNSAAYAAVGITASTPNPPGGDYGARNGTLTGIVAEAAAMIPFMKILPSLTPEVIAKAITGIAEMAAKQGVTYTHEAATGAIAGPKEVDLLHQVFGQAGFPIRGSMSLWGLNLADFTAAGIVPGSGDDRLRSQTVKWVSDGSNQGYTGYMRENYLGRDTRGEANFTQSELETHFAATVAAGWPIMCHANGDAAVDMVMAAFAATAKLPAWDAAKRHRTEHSSLLHDEHIAAMASLGVTPSFLMNHVRLWGKVMRDEILGPERANLLDRYASAVKAGIRASFHCDFSVSPLGPLNYIATAAARTMADGGEVLNAAERVSVAQALKGSTIDAAWMCHADGLVGSLEAGKAADFVFLGDDPLAHEKDPDAVRDIAVQATYSDGAQVYSA
ncbi:amidohydrolase [Mycolicibacterium sp.]|uniref:amidohydrolase n=1 Tax=Mycolicibacterium sp. TaxID=2320850 RepID=UPI0025F7EC89|nr:amidohydrolase [Mycolicibacterium sp.]